MLLTVEIKVKFERSVRARMIAIDNLVLVPKNSNLSYGQIKTLTNIISSTDSQELIPKLKDDNVGLCEYIILNTSTY